MAKRHGDDPGETESRRLNRQLDQLLQELRVAMAGVQVLFALLLAVAFQQRFAHVPDFQKDVPFAMNGAILLVADVLFDGAIVAIAVAVSAAVFIGLWFVLGVVRRVSKDRSRYARSPT